MIQFDPIDVPVGTITSTISVGFHEPSHRAIAKNYWKYWTSQQDAERVIDIDAEQTMGAFNVHLDSFDRITFDWHSRFGAKIFIRFNCLSTDFSRIKGVKGIPLRLVVETQQCFIQDPMLKGESRFDEKRGVYEYNEICYCKIKLFRDKVKTHNSSFFLGIPNSGIGSRA